jgi:predicted nucleotidyltransferase component of viral defense system
VGGQMLTLEQIREYFPDHVVKRNPRGILVEYLQYELLDSLFKFKEAASLSFIGGTAIRMLQQSPRFSEDLDFDNFSLTFRQFEEMLHKTCKDMEAKGFLVECRTVERGAHHCYLRFPEILYKSGISPDAGQKILIRIDTERKERFYEPRRYLLNKFTIYRQILTAPVSILLSQKIMTVMQRKREKGRDLFDISILMGAAQPDFDYIAGYLGIEKKEIIEQFTKRVEDLDLEYLARDVEPFLFSPEQKERVLTFREYWQQHDTG